MMNNLIKKIKSGENVEEIIKFIMSDLFINGPTNSTFLEILSYIKLYQPNILETYEDEILCLMGLFFKNDLTCSSNIKTTLFHNYKNAIFTKYNNNFTPVQANIINNVDDNKYFSFSSATSTGKSYVFRKLILEEENDIAIIVPSRALINEYYIKTSSLIREKSVNILTFPDIINTKNAIKNIFILTPERAKELFKIKDRINIKLVLFDEAQIGDEDSKRGIFFDSIVRRVRKNFSDAKMLFAHPYIENPEAQLEKNRLVDDKYMAINYTYKNVGQIYTCVDENFNYYHFGIDKEVMGNTKVNMDYDPIKRCILQKGTVLIYTSKASIYNGSILKHMESYINICPDLTEEKALLYISQIKEVIGGSSNESKSTYSQLLKLLKKGIVIHHGSLPLSVRVLVEKFTQEGFCRLCFATSTLYQGINMPFDIVYIKRFEGSKNLLIKNLIGRAGRSSDEKKFDYGQIIVSVSNMSDIRNCLNEKNVISNESQLDVIDENDEDEIIEFKEALRKDEFDDMYNMTNNQLSRLKEQDIDECIINILDNLLKDGKFIDRESYNELDDEKKMLIMNSFEKIYTKHLKNRELTIAEREILFTAIKIFMWQINGKKFKEIVGYRFAYITRKNERVKLESLIEKEKDDTKKMLLTKAYSNLKPRFTIAPAQLPNNNLANHNIYAGMEIKDVGYDLVMYDTYDYIDKVWGFCLIDIFFAAFDLYYERSGDERAKIMSKYIKYSITDEKEIWLIRYGFEFEEIEWIKPYVKHISESCIEFSEKINDLDEDKKQKIERFM